MARREGDFQGPNMKRYILLCSVSAILGGAAALLLVKERAGWPAATAQERDRPGAGQPIASPRGEEADAPLLAQLGAGPARPAADPLAYLTPEERVNVSVYEKGSPSVVNISTRAARGEGFFMFEPAAEGAGSGCVLDR